MNILSQKQLQNFLSKNGFYNFQKLNYLPKLRHQIKKALSITSPTNFTLPFLPINTPNHFVLMELGGTYLRISEHHQGKVRHSQSLPFYQKKIYTPDLLCQDLCKHLKKFLTPTPADNPELILVIANALHSKLIKKEIHGTLLFFGKNHQEKGLLGTDLQPVLQKHLRQNKLNFSRLHLVNDTVISTLSAYTDQHFTSPSAPTIITLIVGTGVNLSLALPKKQKIFLANLEMGDFNFLQKSVFDRKLDADSLIPRRFLTEKILSGAWTIQLYKIILNELHQSKLFPTKNFLQKIKQTGPAELEKYFQNSLSPEEQIYQQIWTEIHNRGAFVNALISSQFIKILKPKNRPLLLLTGSLLEHPTYYQQRLLYHLDQFCQQYRIEKPKIAKIPPSSLEGAKILLKVA
ncbi:hypothetical protein IT411_00965 [Candidatus Peregrinibacteria bacterium]|nr:hypothetical protein [Candidatus Peregrinibacteria bacterium]